MHKLILCTLISILVGVVDSRAQNPSQTARVKIAMDPQRLADNWVVRLNALGQWAISPEGKEEPDEVINHMMELYASDVIAQVPPHAEDQIGPVMLRGSDQLRKWIDKIARTQVKLSYYIERIGKEVDGQEIQLPLIYAMPLPAGGLGISFEIFAVYSLRQDRRRFVAPGAVFLQFGEDGKIHRLRLYLKDETREVVPM